MSTDLLLILIVMSAGVYIREMTVRGQKALERLAESNRDDSFASLRGKEEARSAYF